jgi:hypothetical protein
VKELSSIGALRRLPSDGETRKRIDRLNKRLSRYKASPALMLGGFKEVPSGDSPEELAECLAVRNLIQLAISGLLGSLTQCECEHAANRGQWFFARFAHQRFCSADCRIRFNASSEHAKKYRREKQREYYQFKKIHPRKGVRRGSL